ncbi:MAG: hypothetical protein K2M79_07130 [Muribaculaceae bacterium]|nr:hypothetical protein [Muribaculaceae bacterium]
MENINPIYPEKNESPQATPPVCPQPDKYQPSTLVVMINLFGAFIIFAGILMALYVGDKGYGFNFAAFFTFTLLGLIIGIFMFALAKIVAAAEKYLKAE